MREGIIERLFKFLLDLALRGARFLVKLVIKILEEILRRIGM